MANLSPQEQLMLELVNRARMNPAAEAARFGINLNQGLAPGTISTAAKQVLSSNDLLNTAANSHNSWMLSNNQFDHNEFAGANFTGVTYGNRLTAVGYAAVGGGENIGFVGQSGALTQAYINSSILQLHEGLFESAGHRVNLLDDSFSEVGLGHGTKNAYSFPGSGGSYNSSVVTQAFGTRANTVFVTGVIYNDTTVNDNFFTIGEQTINRAVTSPGAANDASGTGGGYELTFAQGVGVKTVTFSLVGGAVAVSVNVATTNIKIDIVNGKEVWTNTDLTYVSGPVTEMHALGILGVDLTGGGLNDKLFGNAAVNILNGNGGNDTLNGMGGGDRMFGRAGIDTYVVDNANDIVDETGGSGLDTVQSSITFSLALTTRVIGAVERLTLTGSAANGTGNALANLITGNALKNILNGQSGNDVLNGGLGNDKLYGLNDSDVLNGQLGIDSMYGGAGQDFFVFNTALNAATNRDYIADFSVADDTIRLDNAIFTKLGAVGPLNPLFLRKAAAALDANDYIVYNPATGALSYDSNGNAAGGMVLFVTLSTKPNITSLDFTVI